MSVLICIDMFMIFVVIIVVMCLFFFFKQKTAYEMRISDWSSDVCSSDLDVDHEHHVGQAAHVADAAKRCLELVALAGHLKDFLLREPMSVARQDRKSVV